MHSPPRWRLWGGKLVRTCGLPDVTSAWLSPKTRGKPKMAPKKGAILAPVFGPQKVKVHYGPSLFAARKRGSKTDPFFGAVHSGCLPYGRSLCAGQLQVRSGSARVCLRSSAPSAGVPALRRCLSSPSALGRRAFSVQFSGRSFIRAVSLSKKHPVFAVFSLVILPREVRTCRPRCRSDKSQQSVSHHVQERASAASAGRDGAHRFVCPGGAFRPLALVSHAEASVSLPPARRCTV